MCIWRPLHSGFDGCGPPSTTLKGIINSREVRAKRCPVTGVLPSVLLAIIRHFRQSVAFGAPCVPAGAGPFPSPNLAVLGPPPDWAVSFVRDQRRDSGRKSYRCRSFFRAALIAYWMG